MVQSLSRLTEWKGLNKSFGLLLIDECHHMPAKIFRDVVTKFNANYLYGLTATPKRKYNDEKLIYAYLGEVIREIPKDYQKNLTRNNERS
jgi:superfamily II DNA or RNA helicase